ncbi:unnamed protein product [Clavelina lepadiformis]|uniref:Uncharacterized protein n=1 Tax=Clavelina lepadiformis TaxID=159417 RepID=A0ABP0FGR1_CLALP
MKCDGIMECLLFEDECSKEANCLDRSHSCDEIPIVSYDPQRSVSNFSSLSSHFFQDMLD